MQQLNFHHRFLIDPKIDFKHRRWIEIIKKYYEGFTKKLFLKWLYKPKYLNDIFFKLEKLFCFIGSKLFAKLV